LNAAYPGIIYFSPLFIILILAPQITEKGVVLRPLVKAVLFSGFLLILPILYSLLIFGPSLSTELTIPLVNLNSYIEKLMILERIDPFFVFYWIGGGVFKTAILYYGAVYTAQKLFKLSTFYLFIPLFAVPVFFISFNLIEDINKLKTILLKSIPFFLGILVFYPLLLLLFSIIRGVNYNEKNP
ncbi:MAG: GerAB/ArcD/ProY family transporter, partial [Halanaerobiaceae bacterium]